MRQWLVLAAAALAAFGAGLGGSFHFDDYSIFSDPVLTSPSGWLRVWQPARVRPLAQLTFWANYQLGGRSAVGYLAVNLALHAAVALLLWRVLRRVVPERAAWLAALLFSIHPAASEAVLYVWARPILMAALLALAAARAWLDGRRWIAVAWFGAALLAKEEVAGLPAVLALYEFSRRKSWREFAAPLAGMASLAVAAALRVIWAAQQVPGGGVAGAAGITPAAYLAAQGAAVLRYLRLFVFPWGFTVDPEVRASYLAWLLLFAIVALAARLRAGWVLAALILLVPSSSVFPAADLAADRRMYLPLTLLAAAAALPLQRLKPAWVAALGAVLVLVSISRTQVWRTEEALWSEAVRRAPDKLRPKIQYARAVEPARRLALLRDVAPGDPRVATELGRAQLELGRPAEALREFGRALALAPGDPQALNNRGVALLALGQAEAARQDFARALAIDPCLAEPRANLLRLGVVFTPPAPCP